jgi:hypothetical protein
MSNDDLSAATYLLVTCQRAIELRIIILHPLSAAGEERVDERSKVGVSQPGGQKRQ